MVISPWWRDLGPAAMRNEYFLIFIGAGLARQPD